MLLRSIGKLLEFVTKTWSAFRCHEEHSLDFTVAAVTISSLEEQMRKVCSKDTKEIIRIHYEGHYRSMGLQPENKEPGDPITFAAYPQPSAHTFPRNLVWFDRYAESDRPVETPRTQSPVMADRKLFAIDPSWLAGSCISAIGSEGSARS